MTVETTLLSPDKAFYDAEAIGLGGAHATFVREISSYFASYASRLGMDLGDRQSVIVELGAGSCTLSCNASLLPNVSKVIATDISSTRMEKSIEATAALIGADRGKISTVECDFNSRLPFDNESVDAVLFDAAMHHARNIWSLLSECKRILRPNGILVAQRESYLSPLRSKSQMASLLATPEVSAQVSENMYLKHQYEYYIQVNGFAVEFLPFSNSRLKRLLRFANGWLFVDGTLYCHKN